MQEPLFIQLVLQENLGGKLPRDIYGYDIPSDHTGECWPSAPIPDGTGVVENGTYGPAPAWMSFIWSILSCSKIRLRPSSRC